MSERDLMEEWVASYNGIRVERRASSWVEPGTVTVMLSRDGRTFIVLARHYPTMSEVMLGLAEWFRVRVNRQFQRREFQPSYELPRWIPNFWVSAMWNGSWQDERTQKRRAAWNRGKFRVVAKSENRCAWIVTPVRWAWVARAAIWWRHHRWCLEEAGIALGLLRSPIEGDYYANFRFDPPDLWGTPLRQHEGYLA